MKNSRKFAHVAFALVVSLSLTACNTIQGAGKDISSAGEKLEDIAE